jgi:hypothetical protein
MSAGREAEPDPRVGRPRKATPEKTAEIERLRTGGLTWPEIGRRLQLNPETCRRAAWAAKKARRAVGNPPAAVNNPPKVG